ncbi:putative Polyprotein [Cucumis melo var. makuwa]|uniref:Polyprotein n=1 Tax=Cucumis melo var. makuwa TaxID=1194695 RepID=A0A5A7UG71_CUCMM|nr:putative Polyprotein [Cucumis melo var. makuwa]
MYNVEDPKDLTEALSLVDANLWQEAINDEMDSLESNITLHLVDLPPGCKAIGCKWALRKKLKLDGSIDKYKAKLVAKGFRQRENVDFFDTFFPVTRITSIRVLISIAALNNLLIHKMDVETAFLNGDLEEEIYMEPEGFIVHGQESKVCKLDKSLYGLKKVPKQWHKKFDNLPMSKGFKIINDVKFMSSAKFDMKDIGEADVIFGIKIRRTKNGISLDQSHYIEKILKKYNYFDSKPTCTPYDSSVKLFKNTGDSVNPSEVYQQTQSRTLEFDRENNEIP